MAGRSKYTEADKAKVFVVLTTNEGNVKRTARETGVPENTVRRWKQDFEVNGPPEVEDVERAVTDFTGAAVDLRDLGMGVIRMKLELLQQNPKDAKIAELTTLVGVLTDKIDRAAGVAMGRVVHEHQLPAPEEIRASLLALVLGAQEQHAIRDAEIVDAELVEQPALPAGR